MCPLVAQQPGRSLESLPQKRSRRLGSMRAHLFEWFFVLVVWDSLFLWGCGVQGVWAFAGFKL